MDNNHHIEIIILKNAILIIVVMNITLSLQQLFFVFCYDIYFNCCYFCSITPHLLLQSFVVIAVAATIITILIK